MVEAQASVPVLVPALEPVLVPVSEPVSVLVLAPVAAQEQVLARETALAMDYLLEASAQVSSSACATGRGTPRRPLRHPPIALAVPRRSPVRWSPRRLAGPKPRIRRGRTSMPFGG